METQANGRPETLGEAFERLRKQVEDSMSAYSDANILAKEYGAKRDDLAIKFRSAKSAFEDFCAEAMPRAQKENKYPTKKPPARYDEDEEF